MPSASEPLERIPMSWDEFETLPEGVRAEYVDGVALVTPPARFEHNDVGVNLLLVLRGSLRGLRLAYDVGLVTGPRRRRIPDIVAFAAGVDARAHWQEATPVLVVEILSPSTRSEDTLRKTGEYAGLGVDRYWIVDLEREAMTLLRNNDGSWDIEAELDLARPTVSVDFGEHGVVELDLRSVLPLGSDG
jgi:Uma2 family endonuclease